MAGSLSGPATRAAAQESGTTTDTGVMRVVDQTSWVGPAGRFVLRLDVSALPADTRIGLTVHFKVNSRARFDATTRGEQLGSTIRAFGPRPVGDLAPAIDGSVTLAIPVTPAYPVPEGGVVLTAPGVYPVVVEATDAAGETVEELVTYLVRLDDPDPASAALAVGVVVPLTAEPGVALDGSPYLPDETTNALERRIDVLANSTTPLTLLPAGGSLTSLAARDPGGTEAVQKLATALGRRQLLGAPYVPLDLGAWVQSGLTDDVATQYRAGAQATEAALGSTPDGRTAVLDRSVTPAALDTLQQMGVESVVVPSGQLEPASGRVAGVTFTELFDVSTANGTLLRAVAADDELADRLAGGGDAILAANQTLAELAVLHLDRSREGQGTALIVRDGTNPDALATLLAGLTGRDGADSGAPGAPMIAPVTLDDLAVGVDAAVTISRGNTTTLVRTYQSDPPASLGTYPEDLRQADRSLAGLVSLVPDDQERQRQVEQSILTSGWRTFGPAERNAYLGAAEASIEATTNEIVVPAQQVVTLTSRSGKVPLNLENRLPYPVRVRILLSSAKLDFPEGAVIEQELDAATTTRLDLPVTTKASGAFPLDVTIRSADGSLPVTTTRFTVRSTAISGVGLMLSIGAGLFLLVWWARHFRTARRARGNSSLLTPASHPSRVSTLRPRPNQRGIDDSESTSSPTARATSPRPRPTRSDIGVVPLTIRFGDEEFVDREQLSVEDFYAKMASTGLLPETAAPVPGRVRAGFRAAATAGADAVVCINLSSELSATMQSAQTAARALEGELDVRVIDSLSITGGPRHHGPRRRRAAADGADADDVEALVAGLVARTEVFGALDTLENLKKGGRIGGAQALLGSMLSIKPIIDITDGAVEEAGKQRTRKPSPRVAARHAVRGGRHRAALACSTARHPTSTSSST